MAKIEELARQISDAKLRDEIAAEIRELKKRKRFGLVFEEHLPEMLRLPKAKIRLGNLVAHHDAPGSKVWRVIGINGKKAKCRQPITQGKYDREVVKEFRLEELVLVVSFGEPIYPILTPIDRVERGGSDKPWHVLINADNYHALQLLLYSHERNVNLIYIDPPYNTGARDWKYNNDYVDASDAWRHSKWLSMIKKRLVLAKRLLKPDGALICTIDEHEVHHLGVLLAQIFPEAAIQMVTIVINQKGVAQGRLARVEEYAFFVFFPNASVKTHHDDLLSPDRVDTKRFTTPRWEWLLRGGNNSKREDRPGLFYPVFIEPDTKRISSVGEVLPLSELPDLSKTSKRTVAWPVRRDASLGNWQVKPATLRNLVTLGYVRLGGFDAKRNTWTIQYLNQGTRARIESGEIRIVNRDLITGAVELEYASPESRQRNLKTVWHRAAHDSGIYGSTVLRTAVGSDVDFAFPKSIYAVRDAIAAVIRDDKSAVVLDFFAGSGTTLQSVALLNVDDNGQRQCILVTNNEVSEAAAKKLRSSGSWPGDDSFETHGIAESVAWPRCRNVIMGSRQDGTPLAGTYLNEREMKEGFDENLEYFRLDFADPADVERGDAFEGILPILWLMAGAIGERESRRGATPWYIARQSPFAVLIQETKFRDFQKELRDRKDVTKIFLITDSDDNFGSMRRELGRQYRCVQLYRSYLENFRINTVDRHAAGHDEDLE